ncbi:MAG: menaquinone biosynthesis protein [Acidobacteriota bacterium]
MSNPIQPAATGVPNRPRVAAVSYLNTVPLVWGMMYGPQRDVFDVHFDLPSLCARELVEGRADLGIVPVAEVWRNGWDTVPGCSIACRGEVRSILLVSRKPWNEIQTLAADRGSRSSVLLARILLSRRYGAHPRVVERVPELAPMLAECDAALLIGDAALRLDPATLPYPVLDLGTEWMALTGLPMVFATWSGPAAAIERHGRERLAEAFGGSLAHGLSHMSEIVVAESAARRFDAALVERYLTRNVIFSLGAEELAGRETYLRYAEELQKAAPEAALPLETTR